MAGVVLFLAAALLIINRWENREIDTAGEATDASERMRYDEEPQSVVFEDEWYTEREDLDVILVAGIDRLADQAPQEDVLVNYQQADFLLLLVLDRDAETCKAIQINRDTMANVNYFNLKGQVAGTRYEQVALSHSYGTGGEDSCRNMVACISDLLFGITIDHYVVFTMDAVVKCNDAVGGIPIVIRDDFSGVRDDWKIGDTVLLQGDDALTFVRARSALADSTNLSRMARQRQYLTALRDKFVAFSAADKNFVFNTAISTLEYLFSDCSVEQLTRLFNASLDYEIFDLVSPEGTAKVGEKFMEFTVDDLALQKLVITTFFEPTDESAPE